MVTERSVDLFLLCLSTKFPFGKPLKRQSSSASVTEDGYTFKCDIITVFLRFDIEDSTAATLTDNLDLPVFFVQLFFISFKRRPNNQAWYQYNRNCT